MYDTSDKLDEVLEKLHEGYEPVYIIERKYVQDDGELTRREYDWIECNRYNDGMDAEEALFAYKAKPNRFHEYRLREVEVDE